MRRRVLLALCALVAPLALWSALPMGSEGQSLGKLERRIDTAREKLGRKKGAERLLTREISTYSRRIARLDDRIGSLRSRQQRLQADLDRKRAELTRIQDRLRSERARLTRLRKRLAEARAALRVRLLELYKADKPDLLSVVLNSDGFADLLERADFLQRIADQDRQIVDIVRKARVDAKRTAERLDVLERRQQRVTATVLARRNQIVAVKDELIGTKVGAASTRQDKQRALGKVRRDRQELQAHVDHLEKESAAVRSRLAAVARQGAGGAGDAGPIRRGSGRLIWPVNGAFTSPFGMRWGRLHAGIDIAAPEGTPIRAADSGRVVLLGWTGGYGNYTCVQHTGSMSTCYAHQSRYGTSSGASVRQGQVIGYVGNTGRSFGAHLHFEVRMNGAPVDPMGHL